MISNCSCGGSHGQDFAICFIGGKGEKMKMPLGNVVTFLSKAFDTNIEGPRKGNVYSWGYSRKFSHEKIHWMAHFFIPHYLEDCLYKDKSLRCQGWIALYDYSRLDSFANIQEKIKLIRKKDPEGPIALVAMSHDPSKGQSVTDRAACNFALSQNNITYFSPNGNADNHCSAAFECLCKKIVNSIAPVILPQPSKEEFPQKEFCQKDYSRSTKNSGSNILWTISALFGYNFCTNN